MSEMLTTSELSVFATGIIAGAFLFATVGLRPALAALGAREHVLARQHLIRRLSRVMPVLMLFSVASCGVALWTSGTQVGSGSQIVACLLSASTFLITLGVNVPLNKRFLTWSPEAPPVDWRRYVWRWNAADSVRLVAAIGAFAAALLGVS
jgi:uncharacterized membrane protein